MTPSGNLIQNPLGRARSHLNPAKFDGAQHSKLVNGDDMHGRRMRR
jgi:hypothetical protein